MSDSTQSTNARELSRTSDLRTKWKYIPSGASRHTGLKWFAQRFVKYVCWAYLRIFHDFRFRYDQRLPAGRPYIAVISHTSILDVPALMVADPYDPPTSMVIKSEASRIPGLNSLLKTWGMIPVDRRGRDISGLRQIRKILADGRGICVAPSGTRSADGRLGPINPVLLRLILQTNAAVFPVAIIGSMECLPKGAIVPRPGRIVLDSGPEIDLANFRGRHLSSDELAQAAELIQGSIARMLPDYMKPASTSPVIGTPFLRG